MNASFVLDSDSPSSTMSRPIIIRTPKRVSMSGAQPPPPPPLPLPLRVNDSKMSMKKLNWKIISPYQLSKNSVWVKCDHNKPLPDDIFDRLAENFASKTAKKIISTTKSNISVQVIGMRNAQNILILLRSRFKHLSHEEIKKYILHCDTTMLSLDFINALIKSLPQPHQIQLCKLKSDGVQLIDVEEFLASLCDINRLLPRLQCMKFKVGFDDMVQKLESNIIATTAGCKEVIECEKLHKILHLILSIGNFMNAGSYIGRAAAFELPVLSNLNDIKSKDNQRTLLHSIIEILEENQPDLLNFGEGLVHMHEAVHVNMDEVNNAIKEIDEMLKFIKTELESVSETHQASDDTFCHIMTYFMSKCNDKFQELMKMKENMQNCCTEVAEFFAFDIKKYQINECFKDIVTFKDLFAQKSNEIAKSRESEKVTAKRLYQKSTGRKEIKESTVVCRDFDIRLKRLSAKGLYLNCCTVVFLRQINYFINFTFTFAEIEVATGEQSRKRMNLEPVKQLHRKRMKFNLSTVRKNK